MSEHENPDRHTREVTVEDVRALMGASTPHFALQLRNRIAKLIGGLPHDHPAYIEGQIEIQRLVALGKVGEVRGAPAEEGLGALPSVHLEAAPLLAGDGAGADTGHQAA